jgi:hypothetical protein
MFIGAYWSQRRESKESAASRIADFLRGLAGCGDELASWYRKGKSRRAGLRSPMVLEAAPLADELKQNLGDFDRQP